WNVYASRPNVRRASRYRHSAGVISRKDGAGLEIPRALAIPTSISVFTIPPPPVPEATRSWLSARGGHDAVLVVLLQLVLDLARADLQQRGGAGRAPVHGLQGPQDGLPLDLREGAAGDGHVEAAVARGGRRPFHPPKGREMVRGEDGLARQHHRPLDRVLQLAHVAGPRVAQEER